MNRSNILDNVYIFIDNVIELIYIFKSGGICR